MKQFQLMLPCMLAAGAVSAATGQIYSDRSKNIFFEQFSPATFSLQLLQAKGSVDPYAIVYGGLIEADAQAWRGDSIETSTEAIYNNGSGLYLTQVTLDSLFNTSHWTTAFISAAVSHPLRAGPDTNYYYLPKAFLLLGNLDSAPVYLTLGINAVPFGVFTGSGAWDTPLTAAYFNPSQAPQISAAYYQNGWNGSVTGYSDQVNHENHMVFSLSYRKDAGQYGWGLGAGLLSSLKTNSTGSSNLRQTQQQNSPEFNMGRVLDLNGNVRWQQWTLNGEFLSAQKTVDDDNTAPSAFALTLNWTHEILGRDTTFGLSHSVALHLQNIPASFSGESALPQSSSGFRQAWAVSVTRPFWSNAVSVGIDFENAETFAGQYTKTATLDVTVYL